VIETAIETIMGLLIGVIGVFAVASVVAICLFVFRGIVDALRD